MGHASAASMQQSTNISNSAGVQRAMDGFNSRGNFGRNATNASRGDNEHKVPVQIVSSGPQGVVPDIETKRNNNNDNTN